MGRSEVSIVRKAYRESMRLGNQMTLIEWAIVAAILAILAAIFFGGPVQKEASARYTDPSTRMCVQGYVFVTPDPRASQVTIQLLDNQGNGIRC